jgi:hypothetical protein
MHCVLKFPWAVNSVSVDLKRKDHTSPIYLSVICLILLAHYTTGERRKIVRLPKQLQTYLHVAYSAVPGCGFFLFYVLYALPYFCPLYLLSNLFTLEGYNNVVVGFHALFSFLSSYVRCIMCTIENIIGML